MSVNKNWCYLLIRGGGHPLSLFLVPAIMGAFLGFWVCDDDFEIRRCIGQGLSLGCFIGVLIVSWTEKKLNDLAPIICSIAGIIFGSILALIGEFSIVGILLTAMLFAFLGATSKFWIKGLSIL